MKSFVITLWLAMSLAACPNNCNGHGQCTNGKCECNTQKGLGLGAGSTDYQSYTGADCSMSILIIFNNELGTCPLGFPFGYISPIITTSKTILYGRKLAEFEFKELNIKVPSPYNASVYEVTGANWIKELGPEGGQLYCKDTRSVSNPYSGSATVYYTKDNTTAIVQYSFKVANESSVTNTTTEEDDSTPSARLLYDERDLDDTTTDDDNTAAPTTPSTDAPTTPPVTPAPVKNPTLPPTPAELSCRVTAKSNDLSMKVVGKAIEGNKIKLSKAYDLFKEMGFTIGERVTYPEGEGKKLQFACYVKSDTSSYGYPLSYPGILSAKQEDANKENIIFTVEDTLATGDNPSTCYLLSTANMKKVDIGDSDVAKTLLIQGDDQAWYYPAPATPGSGPANAIPNTEDGSVKLIVSEDIGKKIVNFFIYGDADKEDGETKPVASEKKLIVPLPTDENKATVKAQIYPGAMLSITVVYTLLDSSNNSLGTFTYSTQSQVIASSDYSSDIIKGMLIKSYPEFELAEIFEPESVDYRRMRVLADKDKFQVDNIIYETENCVEKDGKTCPHKAIECSGAGLCDRATGQCQCYDGYSGDACQRMDCPNNCNGNGRCVLLKEVLAQNADLDYKGYGAGDKVFGCLCDPGRRGPDCSLLECPSSEDPLEGTNKKDNGKPDLTVEHRDCSGRGNCDYETGTCNCFSGYYGEACQIRASIN